MKEYNQKLFPNGTWLMCAPNFFDVTYEINPWMSTQRTPQDDLARKQWQTLHHTLIRSGAFVEYVEPVEGNPDLVFTANAGITFGNKCVISKFKFSERQGEEPIFKSWFEKKGFEVFEVTSGCFEGEGDALFCGETLVCGYGHRSDKIAYKEVQQILDIPKIAYCELINPKYYHLDICFWKHFEMVPVPKADAGRFVCNAVVLGKTVVVPGDCDLTQKILQDLGYESHGVDLSEFLKGGGASKCLSLRVDRPRF